MFTRADQLQRKGGPEERLSYLNKLKDEFTVTKSLEAKQQVLANLANFAYDPINYTFLKQLHIVDIFLQQIQQQNTNETLVSHAVGGLCNLSNDPEFADYIIRCDGVHLLAEVVHHPRAEIALNALTTLYYLGLDTQKRYLVVTPQVIRKVLRHTNLTEVVDSRLSNLAHIFLHDLCDARQIEAAKAIAQQRQSSNPYDIPLPASSVN